MSGHTMSGHTMPADFQLDQGVANTAMMPPLFDSVLKKTAVQPQLQSVECGDTTDSQNSAGYTPVDEPVCNQMDWDPSDFLQHFDVQLNSQISPHKFAFGTLSNTLATADEPNEIVTSQEAQVMTDDDLINNFKDLLTYLEPSAPLADINKLNQVNSSEPKYVEISETHTQNSIEDLMGTVSDFDKSQMVEMEFPSSEVPSDINVRLQEQYTSPQNTGSYWEGSDLGSPISSTAQKHIATQARIVSQVSNVTAPAAAAVNTVNNGEGMKTKGHGPAASLYSSSIESTCLYGGVLGKTADGLSPPVSASTTLSPTQALTTLNLKDFNSLQSTSEPLESQSHAESEALSESNDGGSYYDTDSLAAFSPDIPSSVLNLDGSEDQNAGRTSPSYNKKITPTRFLWACLHDPEYNPSLVKWVSEKEGHFEIVKNRKNDLANHWGNRTGSKSKKLIKYEHFSRSIRNHYEKKLKHVKHEGKLECVKGRKLHYRITNMRT